MHTRMKSALQQECQGRAWCQGESGQSALCGTAEEESRGALIRIQFDAEGG